jgi:hypothetical protein
MILVHSVVTTAVNGALGIGRITTLSTRCCVPPSGACAVGSCATSDPPKAKNPKAITTEKEGLFIGLDLCSKQSATNRVRTLRLSQFLFVKIATIAMMTVAI